MNIYNIYNKFHHGVRESKDFFLKRRKIFIDGLFYVGFTPCPYPSNIGITQTFSTF